MNRGHSSAHFLAIVERLRRVRPDLAVSSDFIVGFPGESEAEFEATLDLVREVRLASAFSFKFSARPGTPAALMEGQIPEPVKDARLRRLQALLREQTEDFNRASLGRVVPVLFEKPGRHPGQFIGRSPWLQAVHVHAPDAAIGEIHDIRLIRMKPNSLAGELATERVQAGAAA